LFFFFFFFFFRFHLHSQPFLLDLGVMGCTHALSLVLLFLQILLSLQLDGRLIRRDKHPIDSHQSMVFSMQSAILWQSEHHRSFAARPVAAVWSGKIYASYSTGASCLWRSLNKNSVDVDDVEEVVFE
jgi:hypothetical protein